MSTYFHSILSASALYHIGPSTAFADGTSNFRVGGSRRHPRAGHHREHAALDERRRLHGLPARAHRPRRTASSAGAVLARGLPPPLPPPPTRPSHPPRPLPLG